jgi:16S rRNA (adenine1518-N6/adenine1519-N6)-dimethyltransferase
MTAGRMKKSNATLHPASATHHPSKRLGQNFLANKGVIDRIIAAVNPHPEETIVEIGPGKGALTAGLIERAGRVIAVEFDRNLVPVLLEKFGNSANFTLVEGDALAADFCAEILPAKQARLVANLPYNISTAIVQRLIKQRNCFSEMLLMLQREVVDRMTAPAGSTERGYLSVLVEAYCEAQKLFDVSPGSFRPAPKVWSSVVRLIVRPKLAADVKHEDLLWALVSAGFGQRRKTIFNNLRNAPEPLQQLIKRHGGASIVLCRANVDLQRRAETLSLAEWSRMVQAIE